MLRPPHSSEVPTRPPCFVRGALPMNCVSAGLSFIIMNLEFYLLNRLAWRCLPPFFDSLFQNTNAHTDSSSSFRAAHLLAFSFRISLLSIFNILIARVRVFIDWSLSSVPLNSWNPQRVSRSVVLSLSLSLD